MNARISTAQRFQSWLQLPAAAWAAFFAGIVFRWWYIFIAHPLENFYFSDMVMHGEKAVRLATLGFKLHGVDFLNPVGYAIWTSLFYSLTHGWFWVKVMQLVLSCLLPLLVWDTTRKCHGARAGWLALIFASLHFHFIDYFGYVLSEGPFMFFAAAGIWLLVKANTKNDTSRPRMTPGPGFFSAGLAFGIAGCIKVQIIIPLALIGTGWLYVRRFRKQDPVATIRAWMLALMTAGFLVPVVPLSIWGSMNSPYGPFIVSSYGPMNFLLGHYKEARFTEFRTPEMMAGFGSPANLCRTMGPRTTVSIRPDDGKQALALGIGWIRENPLTAVVATLSNMRDLAWCPGAWPSISTAFRRMTSTAEVIFFLVVWLPALTICVRQIRDAIFTRVFLPPLWPWMAAIAGLGLTAMIGVGEVRYRAPFDIVLIILATVFHTRKDSAASTHGVTPPATKNFTIAVVLLLMAGAIASRMALVGGGPLNFSDLSMLAPANAWLGSIVVQLKLQSREIMSWAPYASAIAVPGLVWLAASRIGGNTTALGALLVATFHLHFIEIFRHQSFDGVILTTNLLAFCLLAAKEPRPFAAGIFSGLTFLLSPAAGLGTWIGAMLARCKSRARFSAAFLTPWLLACAIQSAGTGTIELYPLHLMQRAMMTLHWDRSYFSWQSESIHEEGQPNTKTFKNPYAVIKSEVSGARFSHNWDDTRANLNALIELIKERPEQVLTAPVISARNMFWGQYLWPASITPRRGWLRLWEFIFHVTACVPVCLWLTHRLWKARDARRTMLFLEGNLPMAMVFGAIVTGALFGGGITHRTAFDFAFIIASIQILKPRTD